MSSRSVRLPSRLIISEPTLPVATWKTRTGAFIRFGLSIAVVSNGVEIRLAAGSASFSRDGPQFGGAAAASVRIELLGPFADRGEALELGGRQCGRVRIALVRPDIDVLLELQD